MQDSLTEVSDRTEPTEATDQQVQQQYQTAEASDQEVRDAVEDAGGTSLPLPSLSRRQAALMAAVAVVVVLMYVRRTQSGESAAEARQRVKQAADEDRDVVVEDERTGETIELPSNPEEITELDAAILESSVFKKIGNGGNE